MDYFPLVYKTELLETVFRISSVVWVVAACAALLTTVLLYLLTRSEIRNATRLQRHVYVSNRVTAPALYGIIHPKIIIPRRVSPELYEETKDDYPVLYIQDLSFDGENYLLYYTDGEKEYEYEYPYLMHYSGAARSGAAFSRYDRYILVRDKDVTYEQIGRGMLSSVMGDQIDHVSVYTDLIP